VIGALAWIWAPAARGEERSPCFNAVNVVFVQAGRAGMYLDSVYPAEQTGSHRPCLAGRGHGAEPHRVAVSALASDIGPVETCRGSYQQVVPAFTSPPTPGGDAREFLNDEFPDLAR